MTGDPRATEGPAKTNCVNVCASSQRTVQEQGKKWGPELKRPYCGVVRSSYWEREVPAAESRCNRCWIALGF